MLPGPRNRLGEQGLDDFGIPGRPFPRTPQQVIDESLQGAFGLDSESDEPIDEMLRDFLEERGGIMMPTNQRRGGAFKKGIQVGRKNTGGLGFGNVILQGKGAITNKDPVTNNTPGGTDYWLGPLPGEPGFNGNGGINPNGRFSSNSERSTTRFSDIKNGRQLVAEPFFDTARSRLIRNTIAVPTSGNRGINPNANRDNDVPSARDFMPTVPGSRPPKQPIKAPTQTPRGIDLKTPKKYGRALI